MKFQTYLMHLRLATKMYLLIGSAMLGVIAMAVLSLVSERQQLLDERKAAVRSAVEIAHGIVQRQYDLVRQGKLSEEMAKQAAIDQLRILRYADNEYYFITDNRPYVVMHPIKPELDGKDAGSIRDSDGKPVFIDIVNATKASGAGFVTYTWPKPGSPEPVPKVSYAKAFNPWGWVIGSGEYIDNIDAVFRTHAMESIGKSAVLAFVLLLFGRIIIRSVVQPIEEAVRLTRAVASGDLSQSVKIAGRDEVSQLMHAINEMNTGLNVIVGLIRDGAQKIAEAAGQIASGNLDLSSRTEQQAASLEETASAMEQLTSTVRQNADNARQANQLTLSASTVASEGGNLVRDVVDTMGAIDDSSKKIVDIITVIDGIAFQTNILALNAAVEAARAGDQGRGFAVVAAEVRTLAQRSASAAREIKALINDSVDKVSSGGRLVSEAGVKMDEIVGRVRQVTDIMGEIAAASNEQSTGIEQVNLAVGQMDQVTQQNAALVEEASAAATSLQQQAVKLTQAVSTFKLHAYAH
jgi:methyl-accepting chemotaxis protein